MSTEDVEAIAKSLTPDDYQKMREVQDGTWASQQAAKAEIETGLQDVPSANKEFVPDLTERKLAIAIVTLERLRDWYSSHLAAKALEQIRALDEEVKR